ncbi:MAG: hypothetical protein EXR69_11995 [Myxococcales bacterium]|nr:hypothetical protein [Myxococcales bacterium]
MNYDVVVLGGGLAGLTLALQLKRARPATTVLVVEKKAHPVPEAAHKVGESSVEIGAHYFTQVLGLNDHFRSHQLPKLGLRYFFDPVNGDRSDLPARTELGGNSFFPTPSFQIDRGRLENHLGVEVRALGVDLFDGAVDEAIGMAGPCLDGRPALPGATGDRTGVFVGTTGGFFVDADIELHERRKTDPAAAPWFGQPGVGQVAERVRAHLGATGPAVTFSMACTSSAAAVASAAVHLRAGTCTRAVVVGFDLLANMTVYGFRSLLLVDPNPCRPFDAARAGPQLGEGCGVLVVDASASRRADAGAPDGGADAGAPSFWLLGSANRIDTSNLTGSAVDGSTVEAVIRGALTDSGVGPLDVRTIKAHGTGTVDNDLAEGRGILRAFGSRHPPFASLKGAMGHTLGAAGAIEAVLWLACLRAGFVPGSVGFGEADPEIAVQPNRCTRATVDPPVDLALGVHLFNSFGFGGSCVSFAVAGRPTGDGSAGRATIPSVPVLGPSPIRVLGWARVGSEDVEARHLATFGRGFRRIGSYVKLAQVGAQACLRSAKERQPALPLQIGPRDPDAAPAPEAPNIGVYMGTGLGNTEAAVPLGEGIIHAGRPWCSPMAFAGSVGNAAAFYVARSLGLAGSNVTVSQEQVSFEAALLEATLALRAGLVDLALVGSVDVLDPTRIEEYLARLGVAAAEGGTPAAGSGWVLLGFEGSGPTLDEVSVGVVGDLLDGVPDGATVLPGAGVKDDAGSARLGYAPAETRLCASAAALRIVEVLDGTEPVARSPSDASLLAHVNRTARGLTARVRFSVPSCGQ